MRIASVQLETNTTDLGDSLLCPCCGGGFLHQDEPISFSRREDAPFVFVSQGGITEKVENEISGNPSLRRQAAVIPFKCEDCRGVLALHILQHKGSTYVRWAHDASGGLRAEQNGPET